MWGGVKMISFKKVIELNKKELKVWEFDSFLSASEYGYGFFVVDDYRMIRLGVDSSILEFDIRNSYPGVRFACWLVSSTIVMNESIYVRVTTEDAEDYFGLLVMDLDLNISLA